MLSTKAKKLKGALEKETGKMVSFRSKARYNASQARLARKRRQTEKSERGAYDPMKEMLCEAIQTKI